MRYFLDCEFNGWGGSILSMALARADAQVLYLVWPSNDMDEDPDPWVMRNVIPQMNKTPPGVEPVFVRRRTTDAAEALAGFFEGDLVPDIIVDWPDDIRYFCMELMTGPGKMIALPRFNIQMFRVPAGIPTLEGGTAHNAAWDALALRDLFTPKAAVHAS